MKTKKLIKLLQDADPTGEEEVCVNNVDIFTVHPEPAYWDGTLQILERNEASEYYNVIGARYKRSGSKINISILSITDAICEDTKLKVDYSELSEHRQKEVIDAHNKLRIWYENMENKHEEQYFVQWAKDKALELTEDIEEINDLAKNFFKNQEITSQTKLPVGGVQIGKSYVDTRKSQWNDMFEVSIVDGFLSIQKINDVCKDNN